jgi:hypothetical protein
MMNKLRRFAGIVWIGLGPVSMFYLIRIAADEISRKPLLDTKIQWSVFVLIFLPIAVGMIVFGYYALKGEYDSPDNSPRRK